MRKALVTGGAGFIGRWLIRRLLADRYDVWVVDNFSWGRAENLDEFRHDRRLRGVIKADIRHGTRMADVVKRVRPTICFHLAAQVSVQESLDHPEETFEINVRGTYHLLEALRLQRSRLLLMGTCLVYKTSGGTPISEEAPLEPRSPYAGSKLAAEDLALGYARGYRMPVVVVRPFNTYGAFQRADSDGGVIAIFLTRRRAGHPLQVYGTGLQTRDFLYVEDCADFVLRATLHPNAEGQVFNAGTGRDVPIRDLARLVANHQVPVKHIPHHHPEAEIPRLVCDARKAKRMLGWRPTVSLQEGLRRTAQWFDNGSSS